MLLVICQLNCDVISYWLSSITISFIDKGKYCKVPMVATLVTFGISSLWGSNHSGCRYSWGVVIFGDKKPQNKVGASSFPEWKIHNLTLKNPFICVTRNCVPMSSFMFLSATLVGCGYLNTYIVLSLVGTSCTTLLYNTNLTMIATGKQ